MIDPTTRAYFLRHPSTPIPGGWRWPNFSFEELECRDGTGLLLVPAALDRLQLLRNMIRRPIIVTSAYRSIAYNRQVGGASNSWHLSGNAFDISARGYPLNLLAACASDAGFTGIGRYATFVHVDTGPKRNWTG